MNQFLIQINALLFPYILGYWSEINGGGVVVTNTRCTQMRGIGSRKWTPFVKAPINRFNTRLEPANKDHVNEEVLANFLKEECIEDPVKALAIVELSKPYFLALRGDPQAQYHYCLIKFDPLKTKREENVAYLFPGTTFDLWDTLPKSEVTNQYSPFVGGSLGWLAHLTPFEKTLTCIETAKKLFS